MIFQQLVNEDSGCLSYLIGCSEAGQAIVVDPGRDRVTEYLRLGAQEGSAPRPRPRDPHPRRPHLGRPRPGRHDQGGDPRARAAPAWPSSTRTCGTATPSASGNVEATRRPHARPHARLDLPVRDRSRPQPRAVVRAHGRSALRRLGRSAGSRRRHRGRGHLVEPQARAAAARRQRRDLPGPRRGLLVRQGDVGQERIHDRLRASLQSGFPIRRQDTRSSTSSWPPSRPSRPPSTRSWQRTGAWCRWWRPSRGRITAREAWEAIERGACVVDLRDVNAYGEGHVAGALNVWIDSPQFAERVAGLVPTGAPLLLMGAPVRLRPRGRRALAGGGR